MCESAARNLMGNKNWAKFGRWMRGQTVGVYKDGSINYYECDVQAFLRYLKTGYDKQKDPYTWD